MADKVAQVMSGHTLDVAPNLAFLKSAMLQHTLDLYQELAGGEETVECVMIAK